VPPPCLSTMFFSLFSTSTRSFPLSFLPLLTYPLILCRKSHIKQPRQRPCTHAKSPHLCPR
jgi:hypothetical protein